MPSEHRRDLVALNNRGVGLMGSFEFEQAQQAFADAIAGDTTWTDARINDAIATLNQSVEGKQDEALAKLAEVLKVDPGNLRARYSSGLCLLFLGRPDEALGHFAFVSKADPNDPYAAYYHGQCLDLAGDSNAALAEYRRAAELDPYLRSAFLGMHRSLQRLGWDDEAAPFLETFQRLADNPRGRLAEFKYTRMGRKAMAMVGTPVPATRAMPDLVQPMWFEEAWRELAALPAGMRWAKSEPMASVTTCDIDGDGQLDVFVAPGMTTGSGPARCAVFLRQNDGSMALSADHPLSKFPDVRAALWGDVDNDGRVDVVLCSPAGTRLVVQGRGDDEAVTWRDVTTTVGLIGMPSADGALADLDHDGDLDLLLVGGGHGGREAAMLINLDGRTFRDLTADAIPGDVRAARQVVLGDFDGDRDLDIFLRCAGPPHALLRNDRLWEWRRWSGAEELVGAPMSLALAGDANDNGTIDLVWASAAPGNIVEIATFPQRQDSGGIVVRRHGTEQWSGSDAALVDLRGDGRLRLFVQTTGFGRESAPGGLFGWTVANFDVRRGSSVAAAIEGTGTNHVLVERQPSTTRFDSAGIILRGRIDPGQSMRSNSSGIGALVNARVADQWVTRSDLSMSSTPGQSLQPMTIGLGGERQIDFVDIDWSDGVFQSEIGIPVGGPTTIVETQRQISSCPLIFAFDGTRFEFVSDFLGVGGLGYLVKPGEYAPPRPWENFLLPAGVLHPRRDDDGDRFVLKLNEPMEEAVYLDRVELVAYDVPAGWSIVLDERMGLTAPEPTGDVLWYRDVVRPARATVFHGDAAGADATHAVQAFDGDAVPVGEVDTRFIGRLRDELVVTLEFDRAIDGGAAGPRDLADVSRSARGTPILIAHGWVEYPYGQTNFAAAQAGASYDAPTIEARSDDGTWSVVLANFGYPAGMPREMSVPLVGLPSGCTALRIRTNLEVHWDALAVASVKSPPRNAQAHRVGLVSATLESNGYPRRSEGPHRRPIYDDNDRTPLADMRAQPGFYTRFGRVDDLLSQPDGALAIFGPGEEVVLRFDAALPAPPEGFTRRYVLETHGWCKDMDLFTRNGETLGPIPGERDAAAESLHRTFNVRFAGGR